MITIIKILARLTFNLSVHWRRDTCVHIKLKRYYWRQISMNLKISSFKS